jgi:hypothetical protein
MPSSKASRVFIGLASLCVLFQLVSATPAEAYVYPGTTGMLSQILYVLFYSVLGVFFYLLRHIKQYVARAKDFLTKSFGRRI